MRHPADAQQNAFLLLEKLNRQSDRDAALSGAACVYAQLAQALSSCLGQDTFALRRQFASGGTYASFAAKIDAARLLGLTNTTITADLHRLRAIGDAFACNQHDPHQAMLTFSAASIETQCLLLRCIADPPHLATRTRFVRACATLNAYLQPKNVQAQSHPAPQQALSWFPG